MAPATWLWAPRMRSAPAFAQRAAWRRCSDGRLARVLDAPVREDEDHVRLAGGGLDVGHDVAVEAGRRAAQVRASEVDVHDAEAGDDGQLRALRLQERGPASLLEVHARPAGGDAVAAQDAARVADALRAVVLDVVVGQGHPVDAGAREDRAQLRLAREAQPGGVEAPALRRGHLVIGDGQLGLPEEAPHDALVAGEHVARHDVVVEDGVAAAVARDAGRAAVERVVHALAPPHDLVVDAAIGEGIAAGHEHPRAAGVPALRHRAGGASRRAASPSWRAPGRCPRGCGRPGAAGAWPARGRWPPRGPGRRAGWPAGPAARRHRGRRRGSWMPSASAERLADAVLHDDAPVARQPAALQGAHHVPPGEAHAVRPEAGHGHDGHGLLDERLGRLGGGRGGGRRVRRGSVRSGRAGWRGGWPRRAGGRSGQAARCPLASRVPRDRPVLRARPPGGGPRRSVPPMPGPGRGRRQGWWRRRRRRPRSHRGRPRRSRAGRGGRGRPGAPPGAGTRAWSGGRRERRSSCQGALLACHVEGTRMVDELADPTGFEPAISSVTGWHVGPLHHGSRGEAE